MKRRWFLDGLIAQAVVLGTAADPVDRTAPAPAVPVSPPCVGAAEERAALEAERAVLDRAVGDIALGRRKKRKASGGEVAAGVAGAAASVLLPFGIGALLGVGAKAAARSGRRKKPAAPAPDVPAMIDRLGVLDSRLAQLAACPRAG